METREQDLKNCLIIKRDIVFILLLVLAGAMITAVVLLYSKRGAYVEARMGDGTVLQFSLDQDREERLELEDGNYNILVIRDGTAWIEEASCPDGLCMHMGKISRTGQSIICLPNRLIVEIHNNDDDQEVDATVR